MYHSFILNCIFTSVLEKWVPGIPVLRKRTEFTNLELQRDSCSFTVVADVICRCCWYCYDTVFVVDDVVVVGVHLHPESSITRSAETFIELFCSLFVVSRFSSQLFLASIMLVSWFLLLFHNHSHLLFCSFFRQSFKGVNYSGFCHCA